MEELRSARADQKRAAHAQRQNGFAYDAGALLTLRGQSWLVARVVRFDSCTQLTLQGQGAGNRGATLCVLTPFDRPRRRHQASRLRFAARSTCAARIARAVAEAHGWSGLWTAARASIELLPWQLEPALAVVGGATRLLLGDEVGLGKTIQAGLILAELFARGLIERALILTPPGLRGQWRAELAERFGIDATEFDLASLTRHQTGLPVGANPWASARVVLSSIDLVKRPEHLASVEGVCFDALVVDEAHHVTPGTDRGVLVARLASCAQWLVLMSATPHSGDDRAFAFLSALGGGAPLSIFRRRAAEVRQMTPRRSRVQPVRPNDDEQALLDAVSLYARRIWHERGRLDQSARLVAVVLARRAASSAGAVRRTLARRCELLFSEVDTPAQIALPWEEHDSRDDLEADALLNVSGLHDSVRERGLLIHLLELATRAACAPSKTLWVRRFLRRAQEPVVIFSQYRDTIDALHSHLDEQDCARLHGGLSPAERRSAVHQFVLGAARVLLATDAGGEGLNLQARCRTIVNIELPWNPARLEQRIGRVDRMGQTRRVHAIHLFHKDSIEDRVLATLLCRTRRAQAGLDATRAHARLSLGIGRDAPVNAIAGAVFEDEPLPVLSQAVISSGHVTSAVPEASRLLTCRRLVQSRACRSRAEGSAGRDLVRSSRAGAPDRGIDRGGIFVFESTFVDADGRLAARHITSLRCILEGVRPQDRQTARALIQQLSESSPLRAAALDEAEAALRRETADASAASRRFLERATMLWERAGGDTAALVQESLFDRRARRAASSGAQARDAMRGRLGRRLQSLAALSTLRLASGPHLVAILPLL